MADFSGKDWFKDRFLELIKPFAANMGSGGSSSVKTTKIATTADLSWYYEIEKLKEENVKSKTANTVVYKINDNTYDVYTVVRLTLDGKKFLTTNLNNNSEYANFQTPKFMKDNGLVTDDDSVVYMPLQSGVEILTVPGEYFVPATNHSYNDYAERVTVRFSEFMSSKQKIQSIVIENITRVVINA